MSPSERRVVAWRLEDGPPVDGERWRLGVPVRWEDPDGPQLALDVVRLATGASRPAPPVVVLAGGPGASGIGDLANAWPVTHDWVRLALERHDVVVWDQRGSGASEPTTSCGLTWDLPLDEPGDRASMLEVALRRAEVCRRGCEARGVDLGSLTTAQSVRDVEAIRCELGVERISLLGASYGSHLGLATIRDLGERVASAVLALVEPMDHTHKLPSAVDAAFDRVDALAASDEHWGLEPGALRAMTLDVFDELDRSAPSVTAPGGVEVRLGRWDAQIAVAESLGSARWTAKLPARIAAWGRGDYAWLADASARWRREPFETATTWHMDTASGATAERLDRIRREAPTALLSDALSFPFPEMAAAWGSPDLGDGFRASFASSTPVLFVSGALDGRTPASNVEEVLAGFDHGAHAIVDGLAHDRVLGVPDVADAALRCLTGEDPEPMQASAPFELAPP